MHRISRSISVSSRRPIDTPAMLSKRKEALTQQVLSSEETKKTVYTGHNHALKSIADDVAELVSSATKNLEKKFFETEPAKTLVSEIKTCAEEVSAEQRIDLLKQINSSKTAEALDALAPQITAFSDRDLLKLLNTLLKLIRAAQVAGLTELSTSFFNLYIETSTSAARVAKDALMIAAHYEAQIALLQAKEKLAYSPDRRRLEAKVDSAKKASEAEKKELLQRHAEALQQQHREMTADLATKKQEKEVLDQQMRSLTARLHAVESATAVTTSEKSSLLKEKEVLEQKQFELATALARKEEEKAAVEKSLKEEMDATRKHNDDLKKQLQQARDDCDRLSRTVETMSRDTGKAKREKSSAAEMNARDIPGTKEYSEKAVLKTVGKEIPGRKGEYQYSDRLNLLQGLLPYKDSPEVNNLIFWICLGESLSQIPRTVAAVKEKISTNAILLAKLNTRLSVVEEKHDHTSLYFLKEKYTALSQVYRAGNYLTQNDDYKNMCKSLNKIYQSFYDAVLNRKDLKEAETKFSKEKEKILTDAKNTMEMRSPARR